MEQGRQGLMEQGGSNLQGERQGLMEQGGSSLQGARQDGGGLHNTGRNAGLLSRRCSYRGPTKRSCFFGLKYRDPKMKYTHDDCLKMKNCLVNFFEFHETNCHLMTDINLNNTQAAMTSAEILKKIRYLVRLSKPRDTLVIYFSCHSCFDDRKGRSFMTAADGLPVNDLLLIELLKEIPKGCSTTLIIDACFGGGLSKPVAKLVADLQLEDLVLFTACQYWQESSGGNRGSVFTNSFVELIEENRDIVKEDMITKLHLRLMGCGCLQTPNLICSDSKLTTKIFQ